MKIVRHIFVNVLASSWCMAAAATPGISLKITNTSSTDRMMEVVEIESQCIGDLRGESIVVKDLNGKVIPSQFTYDGKLLIYGDFPAGHTAEFIVKAIPQEESVIVDTICVGQIRHDMQDDYAWENDRGGYRLYGPSYRTAGGKVSGYDIWTKSVGYPVLKQRYDDHTKNGMSYHNDFGSGMDVYTVGPTLGAGMNALMAGDSICYPVAYQKCEILDNGPLRVTAKITCYPENIGSDHDVIETRLITLDRGEWLNRTTVSYEGLTHPYPLTTGIVIHKQNKRAYTIDRDKRYLAYVDLTDNPANGNGAIFIGIVNAQLPDSITYVQFEREIADAVGQLQTFATLMPHDIYTYYWDSGWSKGGVRGTEAWIKYLSDFYTRLHTPLEIEIEPTDSDGVNGQ